MRAVARSSIVDVIPVTVNGIHCYIVSDTAGSRIIAGDMFHDTYNVISDITRNDELVIIDLTAVDVLKCIVALKYFFTSKETFCGCRPIFATTNGYMIKNPITSNIEAVSCCGTIEGVNKIDIISWFNQRSDREQSLSTFLKMLEDGYEI